MTWLASNIRRYAAFSDTPTGGNPAGVVLDAATLDDAQMQDIAAQVGYSETAFLTGPITQDTVIPVRYFAPEGEVDFCGHATIATAVALGDVAGYGAYQLATRVGIVRITADRDATGATGTLESPPLDCFPLQVAHLDALLQALGWSEADLDPEYPPAIGFGGNKHPILVSRDPQRLRTLDYNFDALQALCREHQWITVQLITSTGPGTWQARDPFPWGGVVEDPATGAAAAAFAGYLAFLERIIPGDSFVIHQGVDMGRPSTLEVTLHSHTAAVSGHATPIPAS
ncbi:PhzF family phenazine biosynthesis protein [Kocuria sp. CPCC 205300]|uniref:PhzF family phenazine biosynthesis protein n=1 Tax=Kocuria sabuli TaxID=3071448 RepID=UPI0036DB07C7